MPGVADSQPVLSRPSHRVPMPPAHLTRTPTIVPPLLPIPHLINLHQPPPARPRPNSFLVPTLRVRARILSLDVGGVPTSSLRMKISRLPLQSLRLNLDLRPPPPIISFPQTASHHLIQQPLPTTRSPKMLVWQLSSQFQDQGPSNSTSP